jgi:hypothetical protein
MSGWKKYKPPEFAYKSTIDISYTVFRSDKV